MTIHDTALRPGSSLTSLPGCRGCGAPVAACYTLWRDADGLRCCGRCDHRPTTRTHNRETRPRPTIRSMPRGWTNQGWNAHVEHAKRTLSVLIGLGVGRELGSQESRRDVQDRIREFTTSLLEDHDHGRAVTGEIPKVPQPREAAS